MAELKPELKVIMHMLAGRADDQADNNRDFAMLLALVGILALEVKVWFVVVLCWLNVAIGLFFWRKFSQKRNEIFKDISELEARP